MGLRKIIAKIFMEIAEHNGIEMETPEQKESFIKRTKPQQIKGGFLRIAAVIACPCGYPVNLDASPVEKSEEEIAAAVEELKDSDHTTVVQLQVPGAPDDGENKIATNVGITSIKCPKCDRQFVACWEFDACSITNITLPWGDPEVPAHPSSELSFAGESLRKRMVH